MSNNKDFKVKNGLSVGGTIALGAIDTSISGTAKDVFVYDTSKDSDGGAWRKRCQHTSWYNETLNTSTRGSRKEFPAVAVIVAESDTVTIYDGDDPSMPMWMVFNVGGSWHTTSTILGRSATTPSIYALNGIMCISATIGHGEGFSNTNFISESSENISSSTGYGHVFGGVISQRNLNMTILPSVSGQIVSYDVNDIAMTVLPNAPIDSTTNLPIPTIAVGTDGGVSVIKDDGSVVDITFTDGETTRVLFNNNQTLTLNQSSFIHVLPIPSSDTAYGIRYAATADDIAFYPPTEGYSGTTAVLRPNKYGTGYGVGYSQVSPKGNLVFGNDVLAQTMEGHVDTVNNITSDYNTGYMVGDIKLAALSDTDDTDVTGSELVTNGTFDSNVNNWSGTGGGSIAYSSGRAQVTSTAYYGAMQTITVEVGKTYVLSFNAEAGTSNPRIRVGDSSSGTKYANLGLGSGPSDHSYTITATDNTSIRIFLSTSSASGTAFFDNVSLRLVEPDRSVNNNGLQIHGTIDKDPVATGAELVAYSGFSSSNYLEQPYNSDLDFGTGDFCVMGWVKKGSTNAHQTFISRWNREIDLSTTSGSSSKLRFYSRNSADTLVYLDATSGLTAGVWTFVCAYHSGGTAYIYVNGKLDTSGSFAADINEQNVSTYVGVRGDSSGINSSTAADASSLALLRISATAPTASQIAKIYEDEKPLFQENAKATLYGTSDAVTALAHDDDTNLLHVGTSAGRSVFQGLKRVDNTTDGLGFAISASNDLVVEV
jgi:hypothetical protein